MRLAGQFARTRRILRNDQTLMAVVAVVVGIIVAYAAIGFRLGISSVQWLSYGEIAERLVRRVGEIPVWQVLLVPTAGGLVVGLFLQFVMPGGRPMGVANVIEAMALRNGRMRLREGIAAAFVSIVSLGVGASAGREGPMVHLGASIAGGITARLGLSRHLARTLLGCGAAASVAASFNAPIAGVFFALEVIIGHYALSAFAPVVIASVAGTVIGRAHLGEQPAFLLPQFGVNSLWEFPAFLVLGAVCAAIAIIFMWSIFHAERVVDSLKVPNWLKPAAGGLAVGAIAVEFPQVLGVGYEATDNALNGLVPLWLLLLLIPLKTAATAITLGCRFGGGVFSPSLCLGAMTGGGLWHHCGRCFSSPRRFPRCLCHRRHERTCRRHLGRADFNNSDRVRADRRLSDHRRRHGGDIRGDGDRSRRTGTQLFSLAIGKPRLEPARRAGPPSLAKPYGARRAGNGF